jgi:hypothetical protein
MLRKISYSAIALALLAIAMLNTADASRAPATSAVSDAIASASAQSCDACKPRISAPAVRYLRHNGSSSHEVEVSFSFSLPSCLAANPDFSVVVVQLLFPNGTRRERLNAGVAEGGTCTGQSGSCKTLVKVSGPPSDGRPSSYNATIQANVPIQGFGLSSNARIL